MKQYEAVIATLEKLGGIATLGQIYQEVFKFSECKWNTKTPAASIRRIVQLDKNIYKIKPGLYALVKYKNQLEKSGSIPKSKSEKNAKFIEFNHSYYQGLLIEIGNLKNKDTYVPPQDKNKLFLGQKLGTLTTINNIYPFSYDNIVNRAKSVDVIWFNERKLLSSLFEVEHSTDIQNSLLKYTDLQDYFCNFYIVGAQERKREFESKIKYSAFKEIVNRVTFIDYNYVADLHSKLHELESLGNL